MPQATVRLDAQLARQLRVLKFAKGRRVKPIPWGRLRRAKAQQTRPILQFVLTTTQLQMIPRGRARADCRVLTLPAQVLGIATKVTQ